MKIPSELIPMVSYLRDHTQEIAFSLVATLLMVYGHSINKHFRKTTNKMNWFVRFVLFVLLCTIGYGFLSTVLVKLIAKGLNRLEAHYFLGSIIASYLILAIIAKKKKEV